MMSSAVAAVCRKISASCHACFFNRRRHWSLC